MAYFYSGLAPTTTQTEMSNRLIGPFTLGTGLPANISNAASRSSPGTGTMAAPNPLLPGYTPLNYSPYYGGQPRVPNPLATAQETYSQVSGPFYQLSRDTALANQENLIQQYNRGLPNYNAMLGASSANIGANLAGQLDKNVQNLIWQQAAERGVARGLPGSQFATYGGLLNTRDIALQLQALGQNQFNAAIGRTPIGQGLNPEQWLVSPAQQQEWQNYANTIASSPIPAYAGQASWNAANQGLRQGQNTQYASPNQVYGDKNQQTEQAIVDIVKRYLGGGSQGATQAPALPTSPGVAQYGGSSSTYSGPASYDYGLPNYYNQPQYQNLGNYGGDYGYDQSVADWANYFGEEY